MVSNPSPLLELGESKKTTFKEIISSYKSPKYFLFKEFEPHPPHIKEWCLCGQGCRYELILEEDTSVSRYHEALVVYYCFLGATKTEEKRIFRPKRSGIYFDVNELELLKNLFMKSFMKINRKLSLRQQILVVFFMLIALQVCFIML